MIKNETKYNDLINEKSPYLLQHAENPVKWHAWKDETFKKAMKEDKPIFLSIGYSTCHWCHVMEQESFEDEEIADLLNENFINVKVDREERPDIDKIYMNACQMMTGKGGWPLTIIMTPEKKPFFAATYIPKRNRHGMLGLVELIPNVSDIWSKRRDEVISTSEKITESLNKFNNFDDNYYMPDNILNSAFEMLKKIYDKKNGGFGERPKFPTPHNLMFLLRYWKSTGDSSALEMVTETLKQMRLGGIFDQVGYGFHRYSTDEKWILPHFEKMLYDQAMLAIAYLETYQATGDDFFKETAEDVFTYVLRDMTSQEGAFYSAEDADSEGVEGKYYLWELDELQNHLSTEDYNYINEVFDLQDKGNFIEESSRMQTGSNILYYKDDLPLSFQKHEQVLSETINKTKNILQNLWNIREKRIKPHKDDKILTDWNGLMIAALSIGARITGTDEDMIAAERAIEFIKNHMFKNGRLLHRYREGEAAIEGNLDDYSYLIWGLLEAFQTTFKNEYLKLAIELSKIMINDFYDNKNGALFFTSKDGEGLISRSLDFYDGATPSGNSIASYCFSKLYQLTGDSSWLNFSESIVFRAASIVSQYPIGFTMLLSSHMNGGNDSIELIVCGEEKNEEYRNIMIQLNKNFQPGMTMIFIEGSGSNSELSKLVPHLDDYEILNEKFTFYACRNGTCSKPSNNINELI